MDLRNGNIKTLVLKLTIPAMLAQFVNVLYNIVDRIFISNIPDIGQTALAGVGICAPILIVISAFSYLSSLGGAPLLGIALGKEDKKEAQHIFSTCLALLLLISITLTTLLLIFINPILTACGASESLLPYSRDYMLIYASCSIIGMFALGLNTFITSQGFSRQAMISVSLGALTNIVFDYIFINILGFGVKGAASATILGQSISLIYAISFFLGNKTSVKLKLNFDFNKMKQIIKLGFPLFIIATTDGVIVIILNAVLQGFGGVDGDKLVTVATIATATFQIVALPLGGLSSGAQSLLSYNFGAGQMKRVKEAYKWNVIFSLIFSLIMFTIFQTVPHLFARIFTPDIEMINLSSKYIRIYTFGLLTLAFQYCGTDGLTALAMPKPALFLSLNRNFICCISAIVLPFIFGASSAFFSEPLADILGGLVALTLTTIIFRKIVKQKQLFDQTIQ